MGVTDIVAIIGAVAAPLTLIGGAAKFIVNRIDKLDARVAAAEAETQKVKNDYAGLLVQVQRWRIAFQIVATALRGENAQSPALSLAMSLLSDKPIEVDTPQDMGAILQRVTQEELPF